MDLIEDEFFGSQYYQLTKLAEDLRELSKKRKYDLVSFLIKSGLKDILVIGNNYIQFSIKMIPKKDIKIIKNYVNVCCLHEQDYYLTRKNVETTYNHEYIEALNLSDIPED